MMKVMYIGKISDPMELISGKVYECLGAEHECFRIIDETGEDYLYPKSEFKVIEKEQVA